jgi:hypothetical protein
MPFLITCTLHLFSHNLPCHPPNVWQFCALTLTFVNFSPREICNGGVINEDVISVKEINFSVQFIVESIG